MRSHVVFTTFVRPSLQYFGLTRDLPLNVHLLTLERLDHTHHLLRLGHQAQSDELPLNNTATIKLDV